MSLSPTSTLSLKLSLVLLVYRALWVGLLPWVLVYFWRKSAREPGYGLHWAERFGQIETQLQRPVWFHGASLGEIKGAWPLIDAILKTGHPMIVTTLTPAGRRTVEQFCATAMTSGQLQVAYCPFELGISMRRFIRTVRPRRLIATEIDTWPVMLDECRRAGIPSALVNAQYPQKSFRRDLQWGRIRSEVFSLYDLIICKTTLHQDRFTQAGCKRVVVGGETRFDLALPPAQINAASNLILANALQTAERPVICIASCGPGEESIFIQVYLQLIESLKDHSCMKPLFVHVPRSPQRFSTTFDLLESAGLKTMRRSTSLDVNLGMSAPLAQDLDVLLGDSLGEMSFYLALSQMVVVGNSFNGLGAHNIIEPLALKKPVLVGPSIWGIEYPAQEALQSGALIQVSDGQELASVIARLILNPDDYQKVLRALDGFYEEHAGATARHMKELAPWMS